MLCFVLPVVVSASFYQIMCSWYQVVGVRELSGSQLFTRLYGSEESQGNPGQEQDKLLHKESCRARRAHSSSILHSRQRGNDPPVHQQVNA